MESLEHIPVDRSFIDLMLACILRKRPVYEAAAGRLQEGHFNRFGEEIYPCIWETAQVYVQQYRALPDYETLSAVVVSRLRAYPALGEELAADADNYLSWVYSTAVDTVPTDVGLDLVRRFLVERAVAAPLKEALAQAEQGGVEMPALLSRMQTQLNQIEALKFREAAPLVPDEWAADSQPVIPTGLSFIDERMGGGMSNGEVYTLIGPTGGGKTLLAVQLVVSFARLQHARAVSHPRSRPPLSVLISYEDDFRAAQIRALSFAAEIPLTKLHEMQDYSELSRTGNWDQYELQRFRNQIAAGQSPPGEYERLMAVKRWLDDFVRIGDFSGARLYGQPPRGNGGVREVASYLQALSDQTGRPIGMVVLDWAGAAVRRHIEARNGNVSNEQSAELMTYCDAIRTHISTVFDCPVWVMHQVRGAAVGKPPAVPLHHSDAEYCKSFSVNAWFAFCLGNQDRQTSTCLLSVTKTRRSSPQTDIILKVEGNFARMVRADSDYIVDPVSRRIISRDEAMQADVAVQQQSEHSQLWF